MISLLFSQILDCLWKLLLYLIPCIAVILVLYRFFALPRFVFRKVLHLVAFTCVTVMILFAANWQAAALAAVVVAVVVYPLLSLAERDPRFADFFAQKSKGEVKRSMLMLFGMFALLTAVSQGLFGREACVGAAAILMWGTGDAAAALIGIPFGKHKLKCRFTDGKKSLEGSLSMLGAAFLCGLLFLRFYGGYPFGRSLLCALCGAICGALAELFTPSEYDTVSVPLVILAALLILC